MGACPQHWRHNDKDKDLPPFVDTITQLASKRTAGDIAREEAQEPIGVVNIVAEQMRSRVGTMYPLNFLSRPSQPPRRSGVCLTSFVSTAFL